MEEENLYDKDAPIISVDCNRNKKPTSYRCRCGEFVNDAEHDSCKGCGQRYEWQDSPLADRRHKLEERRAIDATAKKDPIIVQIEAIALEFPSVGTLNMFSFGKETKAMRGRLDPTGASLLALAKKLAKEAKGGPQITAQAFLAKLRAYYNKFGPAALDFRAKEEPATQESFKEGALSNDNRPTK